MLSPEVQAGHYDLLDANTNTIILPMAWEHIIEPGAAIAMSM